MCGGDNIRREATLQCPKCGKTNIEWVKHVFGTEIAVRDYGDMCKCICGYMGDRVEFMVEEDG